MMPIQRLKPTSTPATHEKLERLKRWPTLRGRWYGKQVRIWSGEHEAYWRPGGAGYTADGLEAGIFAFEDAWDRSSHCDPSKRIEYKMANAPGERLEASND